MHDDNYIDMRSRSTRLTENCIERNSAQCNLLTIFWNFPPHLYNCTNITEYGVGIEVLTSVHNNNNGARIADPLPNQEECALKNRHFYQRCSTHINYYTDQSHNNIVNSNCYPNFVVTITAGNCSNGSGHFNITLMVKQLNGKDSLIYLHFYIDYNQRI